MWSKENVNPHFKSVFTDDSDVEATYLSGTIKVAVFGMYNRETVWVRLFLNRGLPPL